MSRTWDELVRAIFDEILDAPASDRERILEMRCAGDEELSREVEALVRHSDRVDGFLQVAELEEASGGDSAGILLRPGDRVGSSVVECLLTRGSSSEVYRARIGAAPVALKVVLAAAVSEAEGRRFLLGARIAAGTQHPHLAEVHECGTVALSGGLLYSAMRMVEGPTLEEVLRVHAARDAPPHGASLRALVERIAEIASALGALHRAAIVHRDVKPSNIVLEGGDRGGSFGGAAVLVDFGLVRSFEYRAIHATTHGTLAYAAPEVFYDGRADARTDVHALGLCLGDLLTARIPQEARGALRCSIDPLRVALPDVDRRLEAIADRATDCRPEGRYEDGEAMARDLRAWLAGEAITARELTRWTLARRWMARHPEIVLARLGRTAAALFFLAILLAAIVYVADLTTSLSVARAGWEAGRLEESERAAGRIPSLLHRSLLPAGLVRAIGTKDAGQAGEPVAQVLSTIRTDGRAAGLLLAARHLERDGLLAHSELLRFLEAGLEPVDEGPPARAGAIRILAQLFFDRPLGSAEETAAAAPVREGLFGALREERSREDELYLTCALGGCGDATTFEELSSWAGTRFRNFRASDSPALLQVLRALEAILRRSHACGYRSRLAVTDWERRLFDYGEIVARSASILGRRPDLQQALENVYVAAALARRQEGLPPLPPETACALWRERLFFAAGRDPRFESELSTERLLADPECVPQGSSFCGNLGRALGLFGDAGLIGCAMADIARDAHGLGIRSPDAISYIQDGILAGCLEIDGLHDLPDPDTRLGSWFAALEAEPCVYWSEAFDATSTYASWSFPRRRATMAGAAHSLELLCAPIQGDEYVPADGYARLGVAGRSEIALGFQFTTAQPNELELRVLFQKAARRTLPFHGIASLAIELDGALVERELCVRDESSRTWTIPISLDSSIDRSDHRLRILLLGTSNTTFRIHRVEIVNLY